MTLERGFTTKVFSALRAHVLRIAPAVIARTYYDPDADVDAATPGAMERHLATMLGTLVALALTHGSTALADHLRSSIIDHRSSIIDPSARATVARGGDVPNVYRGRAAGRAATNMSITRPARGVVRAWRGAGHIKEMNTRFGQNVSATEVETVMRSMAAIDEAAVVPVEAPRREEAMTMTYLKLREGLLHVDVPPSVAFEHRAKHLAA